LFKVIEPAAIQAAVSAYDVVSRQRQEKINYLEKELEGAQYEADRVFLQFNKVDPLNRLVAAELERRWNEKLQDLNEMKERIEKERRDVPKPSLEELETIHSLSRRLPEVWRHPKTDPAVKKKIIRMVVEEVLMDLDDKTLMLTMTIHWKGGVHTQVKFKKPVKGDPPAHKTDQNTVELARKLSFHYPDEEIARILNCHRLKTGAGNPWNRTRVRSLRVENKIAPFDRNKRDVVSLNEAARRLDVNTYVVRQLIHKGLMEAKQIIAYAPFEIESSELEKESVRQAIERLKCGCGFRKITPVDDRQLNMF
jgi:hypothetical protein